MDTVIDYNLVCNRYIESLEEILGTFQSLTPTDILMSLNLLHNVFTTLWGYLCFSARERIKPVVPKEWGASLHIAVPSEVNNSFLVLEGIAKDASQFVHRVNLQESYAVQEIGIGYKAAKSIVGFLFSEKCIWMREHPETVLEAELQCTDYRMIDSKMFVEDSVYIDYHKDKLFDGVTRIDGLFVEAGKHELGWQDKIDSYFGVTSWNKVWWESVLHKRYFAFCTRYLGLNSDNTFERPQVMSDCFKGRLKFNVNTEILLNEPHNVTELAKKVLLLSVLDMPVGATLEEFAQKYKIATYLMCQVWTRIGNDGTEERLKKLVQRANSEDFLNAYLNKPRTVTKELKLPESLEGAVAGVGVPIFQRFRDVRHQREGTFDFLTVEISLITSKGNEPFEIVRHNLQDMSRAVMERVARSPRIQGKELLLKSLYVKEYETNREHTFLVAHVEFKPGLESALSPGKDSKKLKLK